MLRDVTRLWLCLAWSACASPQPTAAPATTAPTAKPAEQRRDVVGALVAIANDSCACTERDNGQRYEANPACADALEARYASWSRDANTDAALDDASRAREIDDAIVMYQRCMLLARSSEPVSHTPLEAPRSCHEYRDILASCSGKLPEHVRDFLVGGWNGWVQQRLVRNWRRISPSERDEIATWCDTARTTVETSQPACR